MLCLKIAGWVANSVDPDETPHHVASHLGLHCLLRPVCQNTYNKYVVCSVHRQLTYAWSLGQIITPFMLWFQYCVTLVRFWWYLILSQQQPQVMTSKWYSLWILLQQNKVCYYHINPKYWDIWTPFHTCPKIKKKYLIYTCWCVQNSAGWVANRVDSGYQVYLDTMHRY